MPTLKNLAIDFVSLVKRGADQDAHVVLAKSVDESKAGEATNVGDKIELPKDVAKAFDGIELSEQQVAAVKGAIDATIAVAVKTAVDAKIAELEPVVKAGEGSGEGSGGPVKVVKSEAEAVLEKRLSDQDEVIKSLQDVGAINAFTEMVRKDYAAIPVDAHELAGALYRIGKNEATEADAETITKALKSANATATQVEVLKTELGSSAPIEENSLAGVMAKTAETLKAADPKLTPQQALAKAAADPVVRAAYDQANKQKVL